MLKIITLLILLCFCFVKVRTQTQTLDYYLTQGLQNSPLLKDYQNQINATIVDSLLIKASQKPKIDANAQLMYAPVYNNFGYDEVITDRGHYSALAGVSQSIFNQKELKNRYEGVNIQKHSVANTSKISVNDLKRVITNQYITAYADFNDLSFNKTFLKLMYEEKDIIKRLVDNAIFRQSDYLSLLIETQTQEILIKQLNSQFNKDMLTLNELCGINDTNLYELNLPVITQIKFTNPSLSPLFMQYKIDSLKIVNEKIAVDMRYRPKLNWVADAGLNTSPVDPFKHFGFSAGINFSVPVYDGKQKKLEYQKLSLSENSRTRYESFFKNQYNQQVLQLNNEMAATKEIADQLKIQLNTAEELITLAKAQLNNGNMPITDFINALKNYIKINRDLNQTQIKTLQIINELNFLMQ